jgi:lipoate-protein ligase B
VWIQNEELAAIGLGVRRWVSMHGFAINVNPNMKHFGLINPCGFSDRRATSMAEVLGKIMPIDTVLDRLVVNFSKVFDFPARLLTVMPGVS